MSKFDFEKNFIDAFSNGEVSASDIDDYIPYWHTHETGKELHEFLGMTIDEYSLFLRLDYRDGTFFKKISKAHKESLL